MDLLIFIGGFFAGIVISVIVLVCLIQIQVSIANQVMEEIERDFSHPH